MTDIPLTHAASRVQSGSPDLLKSLAKLIRGLHDADDVEHIQSFLAVAAWKAITDGRESEAVRAFGCSSFLGMAHIDRDTGDALAVAAYRGARTAGSLTESDLELFKSEFSGTLPALRRALDRFLDGKTVKGRLHLNRRRWLLGSDGMSPAFDRDFEKARKAAAAVACFEGSRGSDDIANFILTAYIAAQIYPNASFPPEEFSEGACLSLAVATGRRRYAPGDTGVLGVILGASEVLSPLTAHAYMQCVKEGRVLRKEMLAALRRSIENEKGES